MIKLLLLTFILASCTSSDGDSSGGALFSTGNNQETSSSYTTYLGPAKTFTTDDVVTLFITHSSVLTVTGSPKIDINIDGNVRSLSYDTGSGTHTLSFEYVVQDGDNDLNGIGIFTSIDMNGGSIQYLKNSVLTDIKTQLPNLVGTNHIIDTTPPEVLSLVQTTFGPFTQGETLSFLLTASEELTANGHSTLSINTDNTTIQAQYTSGSGTNKLVYSYTIQAGDLATNNTHFDSSLLSIDSGSITDGASQSINLDLALHTSLPDISTLHIDTQIPTVSILGAVDITTANVSSYSLSGNCSEDLRDVAVTLGSLSYSPTCHSQSWSLSSIDLSSEPDSINLQLTAQQSDLAGNISTSSLTTITKNTAVPVVTINNLDPINQSNQTDYSLSGSCSENQKIVIVNIDTLNFSPNCTSGTWALTNTDLSSLTDSTTVNITADHSDGTTSAQQALSTTEKNTSGAIVTISLANNISLSNESNYVVSGTCSDNGVNVDISIGSINIQKTCSNGSWSTGSIDVSSLSDSNTISIIANHNGAQQVEKTISKASTTPSVLSLSIPSTLSKSVTLAWELSSPNGFTVNDYIINYRIQNSGAWITYDDGVNTSLESNVQSLNASTYYEFRVKVKFDTNNFSEWSSTVASETKPDSLIFTSENMAMNVGGSTDTTVVAYYDNTRVFYNGTELANSPLSRGQVVRLSDAPNNITTTMFDIIDADAPIYTAGRRGLAGAGASAKGNIVWQPTSWAGKLFSFNATRFNKQFLSIYATENSTIEVKQGSVILASTTLTAGEGAILSWSTYGSYQVISTGTILAFHVSGSSETSGFADPKPLLPGYNEIIGFASNSMRLTSGRNATNYNVIHSNSSINSGSLDKEEVLQINSQGTGSYYQGESLLISADQKISGASYADSNGYCASSFVPTNLMKKNYIINSDSDYVAFASKVAGTIEIRDSNDNIIQTLTLSKSGSNQNAPFKARVGSTPAGYRFFSSVPTAAWYQPSNDLGSSSEDETILYGTNL